MMLNYFLDYVVATTRGTNIKAAGFNNLSRFDGILIIKHIIANRPEWGLKPLMRNGSIYQFEVMIEKHKLALNMQREPGA